MAFMPGRVPGFRFPLAFSMSSMAEKVLTNPKWPETWPYTEDDFKRMDESDDSLFYDQPRFVTHIDDVRLESRFPLCANPSMMRRGYEEIGVNIRVQVGIFLLSNSHSLVGALSLSNPIYSLLSLH